MGEDVTLSLRLLAETPLDGLRVARYSVLHENEQLFAAKYVTYLPSEKELEQEVAREKLLVGANQGLAASRTQREGARKPTARGSRAKASPRRKR